MKNKGTDILIMLPDPRWKRFMSLGIVHWNEFPLFKKMLTLDTNPINNTDLITKFIDFDNSEINTIWDKIKIQNIYMVSRNQEVLKWKNSHRDYKLIGIYREQVLLGVASYLEKIQDNQIQICDVLIANPEDQEQCFSQISRFINLEYNHNSDFKKMVILAPENFRKSLINIGYHPDDYNFLFCIKRLNKNISKEAINISKWYLSAND